jgi:hypothetical protein
MVDGRIGQPGGGDKEWVDLAKTLSVHNTTATADGGRHMIAPQEAGVCHALV